MLGFILNVIRVIMSLGFSVTGYKFRSEVCGDFHIAIFDLQYKFLRWIKSSSALVFLSVAQDVRFY